MDALGDFIAAVNNPGVSAATSRARAEDTLIPFRAVPVFHRIRFVASNNDDKSYTVDAVYVRPEQIDSHARTVPSRFDTVLIYNGQDRAESADRNNLKRESSVLDQTNLV
jgi:hypothetical protein